MRVLLAMLVFIPISLASAHFYPGSAFTFAAACLAIVPLAGFMSQATEELAKYMGPQIGGLMNATFGNATELIISIAALFNNQGDIVKASLIGSIIGNMLLVLGLSILLGGLKYKIQDFNVDAARAGVTMLGMAVIALLVPALFVRDSTLSAASRYGTVENLSIGVAAVILLLYIGSLVFSLRTHEDLFRGCDTDTQEHDPPVWSKAKAMCVLLAATVAVAVESELLVKNIEPVVERWHLSPIFIGIIVIPIIGNAAEHSTAVIMALRNKMDISMNIAISSSAQIAMFVAPVAIFISLLSGHPINILFSNFELISVAAAVALSVLICLDGKSHWYEGAQLLATYVLIALAFYFVGAEARPDKKSPPPAAPSAAQTTLGNVKDAHTRSGKHGPFVPPAQPATEASR